jgi:hypothetical protein
MLWLLKPREQIAEMDDFDDASTSSFLGVTVTVGALTKIGQRVAGFAIGSPKAALIMTG